MAVIDFDAVMTGNSRPSRDIHDWPLYRKECRKMKFDNLPLEELEIHLLLMGR
jgi:hypothetical protein